MFTKVLTLLTVSAFLAIGCTQQVESSTKFYERSNFEQKLLTVVEKEGFTIVEFWENPLRIESIPQKIEKLHPSYIDEEAIKQSTVHLTIECAEKRKISVKFWTRGGQVLALELISPEKESISHLKTELETVLPNITIMTETEV